MVAGRKGSAYCMCLHECLHSFQHYAVYRTIDLQHGAADELISEEVKYHDPF